MNKRILVVFVSLLVVAIIVLPMATSATKPIPLTANRVFLQPPTFVDARMAGDSDNRFTYLEGNYDWTGDLVGSGFAESMRFYSSWVLGLPPPQQESTIRVRAVETIDPVTVFGIYEGSLTLRLEYYEDLDGNYNGIWVIIDGTGDLANFRGQGKFLPDGSITGMVHFDP